MRARLQSRVVRAEGGGYVEIHDLVVETEFPEEADALEMFKARATMHQVAVVPDERGSAVVRLVRQL